MLKKLLVVILVVIMAFSVTQVSFAEEGTDTTTSVEEEAPTDEAPVEEELPASEDEEEAPAEEELPASEDQEVDSEEDEDEEELESEDEGRKKPLNAKQLAKQNWREQKEAAEELKEEFEELKDLAEEAKDELEEQYEAAKEAGLLSEEELASLKAELDLAIAAFMEAKESFKGSIEAKKEAIRASYSDEELEDIEDATENILMEDPEATVLPIENIMSDTADFKFDTPPVIKNNRTLIPVRAITEGFGADVQWADGVATITKDEIIIVLDTNTDDVTLNGEATEIDVPASITNSRMYVPLRFVLESFGLEIEWEAETQTIEIN